MALAEEVKIRQAKEKDIAPILALTNQIGWDLTRDEFTGFYKCYPKGMLVAHTGDKILGFVGGFKFGEKYGGMNMFIVDEEYRGKGIGRKLLTAVHEYLELSLGKRNIFLNGREYVVDLYKRQGYKVASWQTVACTGKPDVSKIPITEHDGIDILTLTEENFQHCLDYDKGIHPTERSGYLKCRFSQDGVKGKVAMHDGKPVGYAFLFLNDVYGMYEFAPLYADSKEIALSLVRILLSEVDGVKDKGICLDGVSLNGNLPEFSKYLCLTEDHRLRRMYTLEDIDLPLDKVYALMDTDVHLI